MNLVRSLTVVLLGAVVALPAFAADAVLFRDVRIVDGVNADLSRGHALVEGDGIARISEEPIVPPAGATVVEGGGRILSPGFIDLHAHLTFSMPRDQMTVHPWVVGAIAGDAARTSLHSGFTTIRYAGGTHPDLARAVDQGLLPGPRIFPSGAVVSQTSGHGDFRSRDARHPTLDGCGVDATLGHGLSVIADGVPLTLAAVRENLKHGATQIKIMGGGGVASDYDPIHTLQPSPEEIRAAVQAASDWGTYVLAHAYTSEAVQRLVENGVKVIEHGLLIDDATAKLCAERDVVMSTQVAIFRMGRSLEGMSDENRAKLKQVRAGQENLMRLIKKYDLKIGFGTDFVFGLYPRVAEEFTARTEFFTPAEILVQATSESAEIVRLAGKLNRHGNFGEIREGWLADLLLIDGDPFEDISILEDAETALPVIMKGGEIVRNALEAER
jgi:imidazolonepropionase-like amidohydrolase